MDNFKTFVFLMKKSVTRNHVVLYTTEINCSHYYVLTRLQDQIIDLESENKATIEETRIVKDKYLTMYEACKRDLAEKIAELEELKMKVSDAIKCRKFCSFDNSVEYWVSCLYFISKFYLFKTLIKQNAFCILQYFALKFVFKFDFYHPY